MKDGINCRKGAKMEKTNCWEQWGCPEYVREYCPAYKRESDESGLLFTEFSCPHMQSDSEYCPDYQQERNSYLFL
jgi:hypothetical protein